MLHCTLELLRRGKPRPAVSLLFEKYRRVPAALKPEQLGQQYFSEFLIRDANEEEMMRQQQQEWERYNNISSNYNMNTGSGSMAQPYNANAENKTERSNVDDNSNSNNSVGDNTIRARHGIYPIMPQMDVYNMLDKASAEHIAAEMEEIIRNDAFQSQRVFNERDWIDEERERIQQYEFNNKNTKSKEEMLKHQAEQRLLESNNELDNNNNNTKSESIVDDIRAVAQEMSTLRELSSMSHHPNSITNTIQSSQDNAHFVENSPGSLSENMSSNSEHHNLPEPVLDNDYFESRHGYSLLKKVSTEATVASPFTEYSQLDLWGEMPKYSRDMIFLYLISRRRNTFAVAYDYDGNRLHPTYTAGNRGLKGGDRGFRGDGSSDNGHQVTSMYLNDLLPKIREMRASAGKALRKDEKINLVVRVMGFYNGRQGAIRAVQDRASEFTVRYLEDITPFPLNGPKMPRGVFK